MARCCDLPAADLGEIERQSAPAAADVQDLRARLDSQLCGEMTFLGELGVVERLIGRFEVGAAILLIGVEEELIKPAVQIVVMGDIAARARARVELLHPAKQVANEL
jgi:hypothetical protein